MTEAISVTVPTLADLAERINAKHEAVKEALWRGAEHAIEAGKLLMQAKATVRHGHWLEWLGTNCKFSERTAQLYMRLAEERPTLEAKAQRIADLTMGDAIRLLEPLKGPEELPASASRRSSRRNPVAEAIKTDPLAMLEKAWAVAGDNERNIFRAKINNTTTPQG